MYPIELIIKNLLKQSYLNIFFSILLILGVNDLSSQVQNDIIFNNTTNLNGLPNDYVNDVVKDKLGFIWIATRDGLCRYDGPNLIKVIKVDSLQKDGIQSNIIRVLHCDAEGFLWIGTTYGGLTRYCPSTQNWKTYRMDSLNNNSLSDDEILSIHEDRKGRLWVGTEKGLNLYDKKADEFSRIPLNENVSNQWAILSIMEDDKGWMWFGTWSGGLHLLLDQNANEVDSYSFRQFKPFPDKVSHNIWCMAQDSYGRHWLGTHGGGLVLVQIPENASNNKSKQFWEADFFRYAFGSSNTKFLSNNSIQAISEDRFGDLWVGTAYGLHRIPKEQMSALDIDNQNPIVFEVFPINAYNLAAIIGNNIKQLFEDDQGIIWISTTQGLSQYNWMNNQFRKYEIPNLLGDLPNVSNIHIDTTGHIWVSGHSRISEFVFKDDEIVEILAKSNYNIKGTVYSAIAAKKEYIYIATDEGINVLNMYEDEFYYYPMPERLKTNFEDLQVKCIEVDNMGNIWFGTKSGLGKITIETSEFSLFEPNSNDPYALSDYSVNDILLDDRNNLWIGTYKGLNRIKLNEENTNEPQFEKYFHLNDQPDKGPISNAIISLHCSGRKLYLGTLSGICNYDLTSQTFNAMESDGFNFSINSIQESKDNVLWMGTEHGLISYDIKTEFFRVFDQNDGLIESNFRNGSAVISKEGNLFFTHKTGMVYFNPDNLINNLSSPPVFITEIETMSPNGSVIIDGMTKEEIELNHNDYRLSISFTALNYKIAKGNIYAYQLEGFEENWNYTTTDGIAVYTNLEPKEYIFKVKASNDFGDWNEEVDQLRIYQRASIWETDWFRVLAAIGIVSIFYCIARWYTNNIKNHNEELQSINNNLNAEIYQRKSAESKLQDYNKELQRSNRDLQQFAYIASHDLKEPLGVISNFAGLLGRKHKLSLDKSALSYVDLISNSAKRLSTLVDNLLSYSILGQDGVAFKKVNLNQILEEKIVDLQNVISDKKVKIVIDDLPEIVAEKTQIGIVFFNLINNAIKFNDKEKPIVSIKEVASDDPNYWKFSVTDNGIGIHSNYNKKIFDIFQRLHGKEDYEGTGIGLSICKKIISSHKGEIWLDSTLHEGTTFYFTIRKKL